MGRLVLTLVIYLLDRESDDADGWKQGLTITVGQGAVKKHNGYHLQGEPGFVFSHEIGKDEAAQTYGKFAKRAKGYIEALVQFNGHI